MTVHTHVDPKMLQQLADQTAQLTQPFTIPVRRRGRGIRTTWTAITHPALLESLREAAEPGSTAHGPDRRRVPSSRPPANLAAIDARDTIRRQIADRRWQLIPGHHVPDGAEWEHSVLRALVGAAPTLDPAIADALAGDVTRWWRTAALLSGHDPAHLLRLR